MSLIKEDNFQNSKYNEKQDLNNSNLRYMKLNINNQDSISKVMSNFLDNITKKKQNMQKELDTYNRTILNLQKKRSKIMSKNNFMFSLSTLKFPMISSRYKDYFSNNKDINSSTIKNKSNSFKNMEIKQLKKSKSEYNLKEINKTKRSNFFKTTLERNSKKVKFSFDLNVNNQSKHNDSIINNNLIDSNNNIIKQFNNKEDINEKVDNENQKDKMNTNIIYRLNKISNQNKDNANDEENIIEKTINQNSIINANNNNKNYNFNAYKPYLRRKKFKIEELTRWEFSNESENQFNAKAFIEDKEYQKNLVSNQIDIIIDNTNFFKLNHINILAQYIKNDDLNQKHLIKLNILIEETSALYIEISHLIIKDFESFLFVKYKLPPCSPPEMIDGAEVKDEKYEFGTDIKLLNECTKFLTSSYEIFIVLNKQSNYIIPMKKFVKIRDFLNRARYNISNLVSISKKYLEELRYEKGIINQFNEQQELIDKNLKLKNKQYSNCGKSGDIFQNRKEKTKNYQSVGFDKMRRLNNLLNPSGGLFNQKRYVGKHIDVDDKMFNKIVEYMEPKVKERFEAFSVTQKKFVNKNKRKVYKFDF